MSGVRQATTTSGRVCHLVTDLFRVHLVPTNSWRRSSERLNKRNALEDIHRFKIWIQENQVEDATKDFQGCFSKADNAMAATAGDHSTWDPGDFSWDSSGLTATPVGIQDSDGGVLSNASRSSGTLGAPALGMEAPCGHRLTGPCDPMRGAGSCCALRSVCPFAEGSNGGTTTVASPQRAEEPTPGELDMALATLFEGLNDVGNGVGDHLRSPSKLQTPRCSGKDGCGVGKFIGDSCFGRSACEIEGIAEGAAKRHRISFPWEEGKRKVEMVGVGGAMPVQGMLPEQDTSMFLNIPPEMSVGPMTGFAPGAGLQNPPMAAFGLNQNPIPTFPDMGVPNSGGGIQCQVQNQANTLNKEPLQGEDKNGFWALGQNDPVPDGTPVLSSDTSGLKMVCQVAGCGKSLEELKDYHQRYRICDVHIKLPQVIKHGRLERFCQQCGRFHDLAAFDGNRRSCRDQLSKHNARRRKRALSKNHPPVEEVETGHDDTDAGKLLQALLKSPSQLRALRMLLGLATNPALPGMNTTGCPNCNADPQGGIAKERSVPSAEGSGTSAGVRNKGEQETFDTARKIMNREGEFSEASPSKDESILRLSMKIFSVTPENLPSNLKSDLIEWLGKAPKSVDGAIRPGCVFLTISMVVTTETARKAFDSGIEGLVAQLVSGPDRQYWQSNVMVVQLGLAVGLLAKGKLWRLYQNSISCPVCPLPVQPRLETVSPRCVSASNPGALTLVGKHLACSSCELMCRSGGKHIKPFGPMQAVSDSTVRCSLPAAPSMSLCMLEVCCGSLLSEPKCVLFTDNAALQAELNSLPNSILTDQDLLDVAMIAHFLEHPGEGKVSPCRISTKARKLLCLACDHSCVALMELMLSGAMVSRKGKQSVLAAEEASISVGAGLKLMHRAVRSGSVQSVRKLKSWAHENGHIFDGTEVGPVGLTPLHLSALLKDHGHMTVELLRSIPSDVYTTLKTKEGLTPFHIGLQMGHFPVNRVVDLLKSSGLLSEGKKPKLMKAPGVALETYRLKSATAYSASGQGHDELACTRCHSSLPLLLLSIMSKCGMCGASNAGPFPSAGLTRSTAVPSYDPCLAGMLECQHQDNILFSITAMCQACHMNSVVVV